MPYWLVKSELNDYSIDDLEKDGTTQWTGVRNYQARNYLRDMKVGELVIFYHSVVSPVGVCGLAKVEKSAYADPTQFDSKSEYYDPKATSTTPRWFAPDLKFVKKFNSTVGLDKLRKIAGLKKMVLLRQGGRLSVQPVSQMEYEIIMGLGDN